VTLIAEDLLLLLLDDQSGKPQTQQLEIALGGALLVELAVEGMVEVVEASSMWRSAKVWPVEGSRPDDPVACSRVPAGLRATPRRRRPSAGR
jgi:hypothetical protein